MAGRNIPEMLLKHISPVSWEHINLTGIYTWDSEQHLPEGFRALRLPVGLKSHDVHHPLDLSVRF
jgi:hypothetical protein